MELDKIQLVKLLLNQIPKETPSYVVNQVCGSGLRSIASGFHSILSNNSNIVVAGGQESMSQAPHVVHLRNGKN